MSGRIAENYSYEHPQCAEELQSNGTFINSDIVLTTESEEQHEIMEQVLVLECQPERTIGRIPESPQRIIEYKKEEPILCARIEETDDATLMDGATLKEESVYQRETSSEEKVKAQWIASPILRDGYPTWFIGADRKRYTLPLSEDDFKYLSTYGEGAYSTEPLQYCTYGITDEATDITIVHINVEGNNYLMYTTAEEAKSFQNDVESFTASDRHIKVMATRIAGPVFEERYPTSFLGPDKKVYSLPLHEEHIKFLSKFGEGQNSTENLGYLTCCVTRDTKDIEIVFTHIKGNNYLMYMTTENAKRYYQAEEEVSGQKQWRAKIIDGPIFEETYPTSFLGPDNIYYSLPLHEEHTKFLSKFGEGEISTQPLGYLTCEVTRDTKNIQIVFTNVKGNNYLMYTTAEIAKHFIQEDEEEVESQVPETARR